MLFYLTNSLILTEGDPRLNDLYKAIRNLTIAAEQSQHLLMGDIEVLEWSRDLLRKDPSGIAVLGYLINNYATFSIPNKLEEYVEVVIDNPVQRVEGGHIIHGVCYSTFVNSRILDDSHVIGEDINDVKFYNLVLEWYKWKYNQGINTTNMQIGGGGNRVEVNFAEQRDHPHLTLAIVDTDKRFPECPNGATATACLRENTNPPLSEIMLLNVHELENLLPKDIIEKLTWTVQQEQNVEIFFGFYEGIEDKEKLRYFDCKAGIKKLKEYWKNEDWKKFMKELCASNRILNMSDECFEKKLTKLEENHSLVSGLGRDVLKKAIEYLSVKSNLNKSFTFLPFQEREWNRIGAKMCSFCICRGVETLNG